MICFLGCWDIFLAPTSFCSHEGAVCLCEKLEMVLGSSIPRGFASLQAVPTKGNRPVDQFREMRCFRASERPARLCSVKEACSFWSLTMVWKKTARQWERHLHGFLRIVLDQQQKYQPVYKQTTTQREEDKIQLQVTQLRSCQAAAEIKACRIRVLCISICTDGTITERGTWTKMLLNPPHLK